MLILSRPLRKRVVRKIKCRFLEAPLSVRGFILCSIGQAVINLIVWSSRVGIGALVLALFAAAFVLAGWRTAWAILLVIYGAGLAICIGAQEPLWLVCVTGINLLLLVSRRRADLSGKRVNVRLVASGGRT